MEVSKRVCMRENIYIYMFIEEREKEREDSCEIGPKTIHDP